MIYGQILGYPPISIHPHLSETKYDISIRGIRFQLVGIVDCDSEVEKFVLEFSEPNELAPHVRFMFFVEHICRGQRTWRAIYAATADQI